MNKYRWMKNTKGGITLQQYRERKHDWKRGDGYWVPVANVYRATRGTRYVLEIYLGRARVERHATHTLREAMRLCKMLVILENRNV